MHNRDDLTGDVREERVELAFRRTIAMAVACAASVVGYMASCVSGIGGENQSEALCQLRWMVDFLLHNFWLNDVH